eukprot:Skav200558  [mRNA]  locus=scaffold2256:94453:99084:+ [translate_table: standard]
MCTNFGPWEAGDDEGRPATQLAHPERSGVAMQRDEVTLKWYHPLDPAPFPHSFRKIVAQTTQWHSRHRWRGVMGICCSQGHSQACAPATAGSASSKPRERAPDESESASVFSSEDDEAARARWADEQTEFSSRINNLILHTYGNVKQCYALSSEKLGEGGFGYVMQGRSLETGNRYAVKKVSKVKAKQRRVQVRSEIDVMKLPGILEPLGHQEPISSNY